MELFQILQQIREFVDQAESILISGQGNPDGDSLCSQLALQDILRQYTRQTGREESVELVIANDEMPAPLYDFLPQVNQVVPFEEIASRQFDLGFILDGSIDRIGRVQPVLNRCKHTVNIDHHKNRPASEEDVPWVDPAMTSVSEMVYGFVEQPDWMVTLHADLATWLYTGIIYDTGTFRYPPTSPRTHYIAAKLMETGIDAVALTEQLLLMRPFEAVKLQGAVLQGVERDETGEILWASITPDILASTHANMEQSEGIITQYAFTEGTKVAILFKETDEQVVRVSFRSRGAIDVGRVARSLDPYGGGHPRAAGCSMKGSLQDVQQIVIAAFQDALRQSLA